MTDQNYQYLRMPIENGQELAITISTTLTQFDEKYSECFWTVAFKHPKDRFVKTLARDAIEWNKTDMNKSGWIKLSNDFTRHSIVWKILSSLYYNETMMTDDYREYVAWLLANRVPMA